MHSELYYWVCIGACSNCARVYLCVLAQLRLAAGWTNTEQLQTHWTLAPNLNTTRSVVLVTTLISFGNSAWVFDLGWFPLPVYTSYSTIAWPNLSDTLVNHTQDQPTYSHSMPCYNTQRDRRCQDSCPDTHFIKILCKLLGNLFGYVHLPMPRKVSEFWNIYFNC